MVAVIKLNTPTAMNSDAPTNPVHEAFLSFLANRQIPMPHNINSSAKVEYSKSSIKLLGDPGDINSLIVSEM